MLIRFSFKNYKSVGLEPLTLEMVSSAKVRTLKSHVCPSSKKVKVLRNAVVYGGNAAGKTTLVRALSFMKAAVLTGILPQAGARDFCRCGNGLAEEESAFDVQFKVGEDVFDYGFSCVLAKLEIKSEWLYSLGSSPKLVFERGAEGVSYGEWLLGKCEDMDRFRLDVYREDFLGEPAAKSRLFLAYMADGKGLRPGSPIAVFPEATSWFTSSLDVIDAGQSTQTTEFYADDKGLDTVAEVLSSFDTGINGLKKEHIPIGELDKYIPEALVLAIKEVLRGNVPKSDDDRTVLTVRNDDVFLGVERTGVNEPEAAILRTTHEGSFYDFDFHDESDGTRRLFDFMDLLFTKSKDRVFVVDELNRNFHPMLTQHLVELFNEVHSNDDCQLVFTTHENDIMSYRYFRRDEIWFVDRDEEGFTRLYPLDQFASGDARSDARLGKRYLEGRYGGVPVINLSRARAALGIVEG